MPFLGKDFRSYGDHWIKTEEGWERTKVLECILDHINTELHKTNNNTIKQQKKKINEHHHHYHHHKRNCNEENGNFNENNNESDSEDIDDLINNLKMRKINDNDQNNKNICNKVLRQPYVYLSHEISNRETNSPKLTVSEILNSLDMVGAVKDIRRFNYVCRLVQLIINEKLEQLSGNAQRTLFMIVRVMLVQVLVTNENFNIMKKLLIDFKKKLQNSYYYYFYYIGSQQLWEKHLNKLIKWINLLCNYEIKMKKQFELFNNSSNHSQTNQQMLTLANLPNDCKLEIMRRLNNGLDLINVSKCNKNFHNMLSQELSVWKDLCVYHYQQTNINEVLKQKSSANLYLNNKKLQLNETNINRVDDLDWKSLYFKLKRRYGHKEVYADMIHKCGYCKCLFWKEIGHPCTFEQEPSTEPITPKKLINLLLA